MDSYGNIANFGFQLDTPVEFNSGTSSNRLIWEPFCGIFFLIPIDSGGSSPLAAESQLESKSKTVSSDHLWFLFKALLEFLS